MNYGRGDIVEYGGVRGIVIDVDPLRTVVTFTNVGVEKRLSFSRDGKLFGFEKEPVLKKLEPANTPGYSMPAGLFKPQ